MRDLMSSCGEEKKCETFWEVKGQIFNLGRNLTFTYHFDELEELDDGRVEEVVSGAVVQQGIDDGFK